MKTIVTDNLTGVDEIVDAQTETIAPPVIVPAPLTDAERLAALEATTGQIIGVLASIEGVTL